MPVFELEETTAGDTGGGGGDRPTYEPIPNDTQVDAVIANVEVGPHPFFKDDDGQPQMKVNFEFNFDYNGQKRKLWGETPTTFTTHPDCKLRNWVQQILGGGELPAGFKLNTESLTGTPVRIVIQYREWDKTSTGGKKGWKNEVRDVMHARGTSTPVYEEPF